MADIKKTKQHLVDELSLLRARVERLQLFEAAHQLDDDTLMRLASFPENNPNPVVEADFSGRVTYVNPAARCRFPTLTVCSASHPWLADWESLVNRLRDEATAQLTREIKIENSWYLQTLYKSDGCIRIYGVDISGHKQTEEALEVSESRYRELVQNANSAIVHWACDGTILFFNEYAETLFGYSSSEVVGKNVKLLVPEVESTGGDLTGLVEDIVAHPEMFISAVNENICRDGRRVWMTWTNKPIYDEKGCVSAILAVGIDITERKNAAQALLDSEVKYRHTLDAMLEGCQIMGFDWRYLYINDAAGKHNRRPKEELLGQRCMDVWQYLQTVLDCARDIHCSEDSHLDLFGKLVNEGYLVTRVPLLPQDDQIYITGNIAYQAIGG